MDTNLENKEVKKSVFLKQSEIPSVEHQLSHNLLVESIPSTAFTSEQTDQHGYNVEWRWRFLEIEGLKLVEISYLPVEGNRKYIDKYGKWVERMIDSSFDKYVVKAYYYYSPS